MSRVKINSELNPRAKKFSAIDLPKKFGHLTSHIASGEQINQAKHAAYGQRILNNPSFIVLK
ncbi:MAG: hypothetical protein HQL26_06970 [Candidatus Omnitrophica bacterium]|nr:hypothetical protein [Candidatus Omnitrophota bacterium]